MLPWNQIPMKLSRKRPVRLPVRMTARLLMLSQEDQYTAGHKYYEVKATLDEANNGTRQSAERLVDAGREALGVTDMHAVENGNCTRMARG